MLGNLIAEGMGITIELIIIYFLINQILDKRENKKWEPIRIDILDQVAITASAIFTFSIHGMDPNVHGRNKKEQFNIRFSYLKNAEERIRKMKKLIDINHSALDSNLASIIPEIIEDFENIVEYISYFILSYKPGNESYDFVSIPPLEEMERVESKIKELVSLYKGVDHIESLSKSNLSTSSQKALWEKAQKNTHNIYFEPSEYVFNDKRVPYVFDTLNLKKLPVPKHGQRIEIFKQNS